MINFSVPSPLGDPSFTPLVFPWIYGYTPPVVREGTSLSSPLVRNNRRPSENPSPASSFFLKFYSPGFPYELFLTNQLKKKSLESLPYQSIVGLLP